jgi:hypothetical protein
VARRQTAEPLGDNLSTAASGSDTAVLAQARLEGASRAGRDAPAADLGIDRPPGSMIIKCSCSVQWNRGMRGNELGDSPGWERAGEIAGALESED